MSCVTLVKAALARFLFAIHILITVWRVVQQVSAQIIYLYLPNILCSNIQGWRWILEICHWNFVFDWRRFALTVL